MPSIAAQLTRQRFDAGEGGFSQSRHSAAGSERVSFQDSAITSRSVSSTV
jgi:hypothetical protein